MIGVQRSNELGDICSEEYRNFFKNVNIGLQFESEPKKTTFFTNHRSLKEAKTKPFKTELVINPTYMIYVDTNDEIRKKISETVTKNEFAYMPYLGHAYCLARICDFEQLDADEVRDVRGYTTKCTVLDESDMHEQYSNNSEFKLDTSSSTEVIVERHIHHFFNNGKFDARVLKHWFPINGTEMEIREKKEHDLSKFYKIGDNVVCIY